MPVVEQIKKMVEAATGMARPRKEELPGLVKPRAARSMASRMMAKRRTTQACLW